jgi:hypothetical protein
MKLRTTIFIMLFISAMPAVAIAEPVGNQTQTITADWFDNFVQGILSGAAEGAARFGIMVLRAVVNIISATYGLLAIAGAILWASNIDRQLGKRLVIGSVILLIFAEFAIPFIGIGR